MTTGHILTALTKYVLTPLLVLLVGAWLVRRYVDTDDGRIWAPGIGVDVTSRREASSLLALLQISPRVFEVAVIPKHPGTTVVLKECGFPNCGSLTFVGMTDYVGEEIFGLGVEWRTQVGHTPLQGSRRLLKPGCSFTILRGKTELHVIAAATRPESVVAVVAEVVGETSATSSSNGDRVSPVECRDPDIFREPDGGSSGLQ